MLASPGDRYRVNLRFLHPSALKWSDWLHYSMPHLPLTLHESSTIQNDTFSFSASFNNPIVFQIVFQTFTMILIITSLFNGLMNLWRRYRAALFTLSCAILSDNVCYVTVILSTFSITRNRQMETVCFYIYLIRTVLSQSIAISLCKVIRVWSVRISNLGYASVSQQIWKLNDCM